MHPVLVHGGPKTHTGASYILLNIVQFLVHRAVVKALTALCIFYKGKRLACDETEMILSYIPRAAASSRGTCYRTQGNAYRVIDMT